MLWFEKNAHKNTYPLQCICVLKKHFISINIPTRMAQKKKKKKKKRRLMEVNKLLR